MKRVIGLLLFACCGCFQASDDDLDLRTVPVTNNPYVVPQSGGFPGQGGSQGPF